MLYDLALLCAVGVGLWIMLDLLRGVSRSVELVQLVGFTLGRLESTGVRTFATSGLSIAVKLCQIGFLTENF